MKKQLQLMLTVLFMVRFGFTTYAQQVGSEFAFNNITYRVTALGSTNTVTATGYNTAGGAVTIPQTVDHGPNTYTVTRIGSSAFQNKGITSVVIANSVTNIEDGAFRNNQLLSVVLPGSLASIGNSAFRNNRLTSVTIPEGVTSIGSNAFNFNHMLNQVVVKATDPPSLVAANAFITRRDRIDLVVPIDALDAYMDPANGWTGFKSISGPAPFVTTWEVEAGGSITIPINGIHTNNFTYDFIVDWGDHTTTTIATSNPNDAALTHTYTDAGTYQVSISGNFPAIHFNNRGDKDKIRTVEQWGAIQWESMAGAFSGCSQLDIMATDAPDLQLVWDMRGMFAMSGITGQHTDLNSWDVSRASLMNSMFLRASNFNGDIGDWDVSNVIEMELMFEEATTFNQDIGDWDVGNVTDMQSMFNKSSTFNKDIGRWDVSNVTDMNRMFKEASAFNGDIGDWDVSNVIDMLGMFEGATSFNQDIGGWDVSNVANMGWMFQGAFTFNQDIGGWDVRNVTSMAIMFSSAHDFNQDIGGWDVSNVNNMRWMFGGARTFNQDISDWNVGNVTNMEGMFSTAYDFNQDIGRWDVGNITTMAHMLNSSGLSVANYGATLAGWAALPNTPTGIPLGADGLEYDQTGATHRQELIDVYGWTITGDTEEDNEAPTVILAPITLTLDEHGEVTLLATQLDDGSTDNRTVAANLIFSFDADGNETDRVFDCGDVGEHQVRLYVTDENENSASTATLVTVEEHLDNLVARAKDITVQLDANGEATISPGDVDDGSSYGCSSTPELSLDIATFDCSHVGSQVTVTLTATQSNKTSTATALVTVEGDSYDLVARAKDITVQLDANGQVTITPAQVNNGSRGSCNNSDPIFLSLNKTTFDCNDIGTPATIILTATQSNETSTATALITVEAIGNCGSATFTINAIADVILRENTEYTSVTPVLSGNPKSTVTWTLGGADAGSFSIDGSTGVVTMIARDFEAPADANADNVYEVSITATDSERNASETSWTVTVEDDPFDETLSQIPSFSIMIPTAFTPNGDGANDVWIIDNLSEDASVRIYDRHGTIIFSSDDGYTNPWDGTSRGSRLPAGSYLYMIQDGLHTYRGSVTILL